MKFKRPIVYSRMPTREKFMINMVMPVWRDSKIMKALLARQIFTSPKDSKAQINQLLKFYMTLFLRGELNSQLFLD